jgi:hypothetical protein
MGALIHGSGRGEMRALEIHTKNGGKVRRCTKPTFRETRAAQLLAGGEQQEEHLAEAEQIYLATKLRVSSITLGSQSIVTCPGQSCGPHGPGPAPTVTETLTASEQSFWKRWFKHAA